jgi:hypothetical protein
MKLAVFAAAGLVLGIASANATNYGVAEPTPSATPTAAAKPTLAHCKAQAKGLVGSAREAAVKSCLAGAH